MLKRLAARADARDVVTRRTLGLVISTVVAALAPVLAGGGTPAAALPAPADLTGVDGTATPTNFWLATAAGNVWPFGSATYYGAPGSMPLARPIVAMTPTADGKGYWSVGSDGGVFAYGDAPFYGSTGNLSLAKPIVGLTATRSAKGYWLVASDGGIFAFGDAPFYGSMGGHPLAQPIVGMASTPDGKGYWLVARDGGIFAFGDAAFSGSMGGQTLAQPIVGMTSTTDGKGYWQLASDGGIFAFGDAPFYGSTGAAPSADPALRLVRTSTGKGYWIVDQTGTASHFGDAGGAPPVQALMFTPTTPGDNAVLFAFYQLGKPYIWGGNGPAGYDCSGLALASWQHGAGVSFARVADDQYHTAGAPVGLSDLQTGDLVFWGSSQSDWTSVYHTAMYVGGDRIVESTGDHVQLNTMGQWGSSDLMPMGRHP